MVTSNGVTNVTDTVYDASMPVEEVGYAQGTNTPYFVYCRNNVTTFPDFTGRFIDLLLDILEEAVQSASDSITAQTMERWGMQTIYDEVARYTGEIVGFLLGDELDGFIYGRFTETGVWMRVDLDEGVWCQIFIDFLDRWGHGIPIYGQPCPHIDFQFTGCTRPGYDQLKYFLEGLLEGLEESQGS